MLGVGGAWFDGGVDTPEQLRNETRTVWATAVCFVLGTGIGALVLQGPPRPLIGPGSLSAPVAVDRGRDRCGRVRRQHPAAPPG